MIVIVLKNHTNKKKDIQQVETINISHPDDFSWYKSKISLLILNYLGIVFLLCQCLWSVIR